MVKYLVGSVRLRERSSLRCVCVLSLYTVYIYR
jgi:hypothetical protein